MSSIKFINQRYFEIISNPRKKDSMHLKMRGNVLVFFKMQGCGGCESLEPIFNQIAQKNHQITFTIMDTTYDRSTIAMSRSTTTSINEVPTLIFYSDGRPVAKLKGRTYQALTESISQILSNIKPVYMQESSNMYGGSQIPTHVSQRPNHENIVTSQQSSMNIHPEECTNEECLLLPLGVIPKYKPWTAELKQ